MKNNNWDKLSTQLQKVNSAGYLLAEKLKKQRKALQNYNKKLLQSTSKLIQQIKSI